MGAIPRGLCESPNSKEDAKFGSISSRETGLIDGFFTQTAKQFLHNQWRSRL